MEANKKALTNKNVQEIFDEYLNQISKKLNLPPLIKNAIVMIGREDEFQAELTSPRGLVSIKENSNHQLTLKISPKYPKFIPMILLREAYLCFLHETLRENLQLQFYIYMLIEIDLYREKNIEKWKSQIRKINAFSRFFNSRFDSGNRLFQFKFPNSEKTIISTFFHYLRTLNMDITQQYFYPNLMRIYINGLKQAYKENEDLLETIRILDIIFDKVKSYRALLDYKQYYKQFKEDGTLQSSLSLRKFVSNVRWISRYSFCSPIYLLDWNTIGLSFYIAHIRFHPSLSWHKINLFLKQLPFLVVTQFIISGFSREFYGYIIIPTSYLKDLKQFFNTLKESGFLITLDLYKVLENRLFFNLNYFLADTDINKFIPDTSRSFNEKFVLESRHIYTDSFLMKELELLDFLILERARQSSITGFGFERRESTLSTLRDDYLTEVSKQQKIITTLRELLNEVFQNVEIRNACLEFVSKNQKYGFFVLYGRVSQIKASIKQIKQFLWKQKSRLSKIDFLNYINTHGLSSNLSQEIILKNPKLKNYIVQELYPLYIQNKKKFLETEHIFSVLLKILDSCKNLKLYDISSIRNIIKDPELFESLYQKKEEKIRKISSQSSLSEITSHEVESRLEKFSSTSPPIIRPCLMNSLITLTIDKAVFLIILHFKPSTRSKIQNLANKFPSIIYYETQNNQSQQKYIYCAINLPYLDPHQQKKMLITIKYLFKENLISCTPVFSPGITPIITRLDFYDLIFKEFFYTPYLFSHYLSYCRFLFGDNLPRFDEKYWHNPISNLLEKLSLSNVIKEINTNREIEKLEKNKLNELEIMIDEIENSFTSKKVWKNLKKNTLYTHFIKSVRFEPFYSKFGFQKYHIYFRPIDVNEIDFKLLISNTFLSFRFLEVQKNSYCFMLKSLFPYNNPNTGYLNWLILSKKIVSEYCLFTIQKEYVLHNFKRNIEQKNGEAIWNLDISQFINYTESVIFSPNKNSNISTYKTINHAANGKNYNFNPKNTDFLNLVSIYSKNIKKLKFLGALPKDEKIYDRIKNLLNLKKGFLKIKTKNLQLTQKVVFLLPSVKNSIVKPILEIFMFFNKVKIYEIEGEYYLHSFLKVKPFSKGLFIKVWFPNIDIDNFLEYISEIFAYYDIDHVLLYTEWYNGKNYLKTLFKDIDLKNDYNPLLNFKWNPIDKIWMNPKLFTEDFKPIYPPLVPESSTDNKNRNEKSSNKKHTND